MRKVVLNGCFGGFSLSKEAVLSILGRKGIEVDRVEEDRYRNFTIYASNGNHYSSYSFSGDRDDEDLVAVVEELEDKANGSCASLYIDEYDDENFVYSIDEYDGSEDLELTPVVLEKKLIGKTTREIVEYLKSLDIIVKTA
jgi:hypothetical protein